METKNYATVDFILNESFQRYVLNNNQEDAKYWADWLIENPDAADAFQEARSLVSFIASRKVLPRHSSIRDEVFGKLISQIETENKEERVRPKSRFISPIWYAAASIIVIVALLFFFNIPNLLYTGSGTSENLQIIVPKGQRSQVLLPDGTKVWLNSGTVLKYPSSFLRQRREVYLEGEAFFNVAHRYNLPFLVHIKDHLTIKVLGTQFNVKCYNEDRTVETTLIKGAVLFSQRDNDNKVLKEVHLNPKEMVSYDKYKQNMTVIPLDVPAASTSTSTATSTSMATLKAKADENTEAEEMNDQITALISWKDDALEFQDETFEDISIKMERWFGIPITIKDDNLKQVRFTGKFVNKETIYQILDIINRSEPIQYTRNNQEIIISRPKHK
ncbi:MAG: FecR family protein [Bacteroidota bacterium]|nr:FecR family protein [Bacteroidota bacterium]